MLEEQFGHLAMLAHDVDDHPINPPAPTVDDYAGYFTHLVENRFHNRRYIWSTIWVFYSHLKMKHTEIYGEDLGLWYQVRTVVLQRFYHRR